MSARCFFSETVSQRRAGCFGAVFSGLKFPFPGNGDGVRQRPVRLCAVFGKSKHLMLSGPFGWHVDKTDHAHATRELSGNGRLDQIGRKKGK